MTPFLIALLQVENLMLKDWILELLYDLSFYHRLKLQTEQQKIQAREVFELVKEAMPLYQQLLKDSHSEVKQVAKQLIENLEAGLQR